MLKFHQKVSHGFFKVNSNIGLQLNHHQHTEVNMMNWFKYLISFLMIMVAYYIVSQHYPDLFFAVFLGFFGWRIFMSATSSESAPSLQR